MTTVELVARAIAASRTGRVDAWCDCRADALLVIEACRTYFTAMPDRNAIPAMPSAANDR